MNGGMAIAWPNPDVSSVEYCAALSEFYCRALSSREQRSSIVGGDKAPSVAQTALEAETMPGPHTPMYGKPIDWVLAVESEF